MRRVTWKKLRNMLLVYIGDNPQKDLVGAKKAGMAFILFRSEFKPYNDFQPDRNLTIILNS